MKTPLGDVQPDRRKLARRVVQCVARAGGLACSFLVRCLATYVSYPAKLALGVAGFAVSVTTFYYVGQVVSAAGPGFEKSFGMGYSSFALTGIIVHGLGTVGLSAFRGAVRREQLQGTIEILAASPTPLPVSIVLSGLADMSISACGAAALALVAAGVLSIGLPISLSALAAVTLHGLVMCGVGLASAGIVLVTKEGEPVAWAVSTITALLGGVYFPVDFLPDWVERASVCLPIFHALRLARYGAEGGSGSFAFLTAVAVASLLAGSYALRAGLRRACRAATLGHY